MSFATNILVSLSKDKETKEYFSDSYFSILLIRSKIILSFLVYNFNQSSYLMASFGGLAFFPESQFLTTQYDTSSFFAISLIDSLSLILIASVLFFSLSLIFTSLSLKYSLAKEEAKFFVCEYLKPIEQ